MRDHNKELFSNKSNLMIQNYAWNLREKQLKIMEFLCSCYMTEYYDPANNSITIGIANFLRETGSTTKGISSKEYNDFENDLKSLSDASIIGVGFNGNRRLIRLINTFEEIKGTPQIKCFMSDDYLECMKRQNCGNTKIEFRIINSMKSRYSIKLYNLLRSWQGKGEVCYTIENLRQNLGVEGKSYENYSKFKQSILDRAINEINEKTSLIVKYDELSSASDPKSKVNRLVFRIRGRVIESTAVEIENSSLPADSPSEDPIRRDRIRVVLDILNRQWDCTAADAEEIVLAAEQSEWWEKSQTAIGENAELREKVFRNYVEAHFVRAKARSKSETKNGFLNFLIGAVRENYLKVPTIGAKEVNPSGTGTLQQSSFETDEFFAAAVRRSFGEDFDFSILDS